MFALTAANGESALDMVTDWASQLSVGEQQRLAFARILLSAPQLLLMDESTSALDTANEQSMYKVASAPATDQTLVSPCVCTVAGRCKNLFCQHWTSTNTQAVP